MGIFNPVGDLADASLDAVIRMPFRLHEVLVLLAASLARLAIEKLLKHIGKGDIGVADAGFLELFGVEWG